MPTDDETTDHGSRDGSPDAPLEPPDVEPSPSGAHYVLPGGRLVRVEEYDPAKHGQPKTSPAENGRQSVLVNLKEGRISIPVGFLLSMIAGIAGAGGVSAINWPNSQNPDSDRIDILERRIVELENKIDQHENLEGHPGSISRMSDLSARFEWLLSIIEELHPRQR